MQKWCEIKLYKLGKEYLEDIMIIIRKSINLLNFGISLSVLLLQSLFWVCVSLNQRNNQRAGIRYLRDNTVNMVDYFWGVHTIVELRLSLVKSAHQSESYLKWRFVAYPLFQQFMELWGTHDGEVILDYGCGPGNDLTGFLVHTNAKKVIGIDISEKALKIASSRLALHNIDIDRVDLIKTSDGRKEIPLENDSVDYIYCAGVLHHTTNPEHILKEFNRVLKPKGHAHIMVYNNDSLYFHLNVAYYSIILERKFEGLNIYNAFSKSTDTEDCPISRCYKHQEFIQFCNSADFKCEYIGGYFSEIELILYKKYINQAISDTRLGKEHRNFLKDLVSDRHGFPMYQNKHAGIGGVYKLIK